MTRAISTDERRSIGEVSYQYRISPVAIRKMEQASRIPPVPRDAAGRRFYLPEHIEAIGRALQARRPRTPCREGAASDGAPLHAA